MVLWLRPERVLPLQGWKPTRLLDLPLYWMISTSKYDNTCFIKQSIIQVKIRFVFSVISRTFGVPLWSFVYCIPSIEESQPKSHPLSAVRQIHSKSNRGLHKRSKSQRYSVFSRVPPKDGCSSILHKWRFCWYIILFWGWRRDLIRKFILWTWSRGDCFLQLPCWIQRVPFWSNTRSWAWRWRRSQS